MSVTRSPLLSGFSNPSPTAIRINPNTPSTEQRQLELEEQRRSDLQVETDRLTNEGRARLNKEQYFENILKDYYGGMARNGDKSASVKPV